MLVPGDGSQLVSLTHAADNAAMIAAALGNSKAVGQIFNCGTTNFITCVAAHAAAHGAAASAAPGPSPLSSPRPPRRYKDLAKLCGAAAGVADVEVATYDPKAGVEVPKVSAAGAGAGAGAIGDGAAASGCARGRGRGH